MPRSNFSEAPIPRGADFHLAQLNVARMKHPKDSPEMADFIGALDEINALAEASDGFIWRMKDDSGNAMSFRLFDDTTLPNLSVWRDRESLFSYVYHSAHTAYLARRKDWFHMPEAAHMVLWWVPKGHVPSLEEAAKRLEFIEENGPTPMAFTFKRFFDFDGEPVTGKP